MSLVWYLNHSDTPNVRVTATRAYALCNIKKGEELTVDYRTLDDNVDNTNGIYIEKKTC
jgi:SET domain-containing protein